MLTRTQLADILDALSSARDLLEGQVDVVDGDSAEQQPNKAMRAVQQIDEAMRHTLREFDALALASVIPFPGTAWHGG